MIPQHITITYTKQNKTNTFVMLRLSPDSYVDMNKEFEIIKRIYKRFHMEVLKIER